MLCSCVRSGTQTLVNSTLLSAVLWTYTFSEYGKCIKESPSVKSFSATNLNQLLFIMVIAAVPLFTLFCFYLHVEEHWENIRCSNMDGHLFWFFTTILWFCLPWGLGRINPASVLDDSMCVRNIPYVSFYFYFC